MPQKDHLTPGEAGSYELLNEQHSPNFLILNLCVTQSKCYIAVLSPTTVGLLGNLHLETFANRKYKIANSMKNTHLP